MSDRIFPDAGQKIDAQGRVSYDFAGHISAAGIDLLAGDDASPPNDRRVRWLNEATGAVVADLLGYSDLGAVHSSHTVLGAYAPTTDPDQRATVSVAAHDGAANPQAGIIAEDRNDAPDGSKVTAFAGAFARTIVNELGQSSFLELATIAGRKINIGTGSALFNASSVSSQVNVNHGLGKTPAIVLATGLWTVNHNHMAAWATDQYGVLTFRAQGKTIDGSAVGPGNLDFCWAAIG